MHCPEFLRHKRFLVSPTVLAKHGIEFDTVLHEAGEFVLTFPLSYHAGLNHGFNIAESTNFATRHWSSGPGVRAGFCTCREDVVRIDVREFHRKMMAGELAERCPARRTGGRKRSRGCPSPTGSADSSRSGAGLVGADDDDGDGDQSAGQGSGRGAEGATCCPEACVQWTRGMDVEVMWENDEWYRAQVLRVKGVPPAQLVDVLYSTGEIEREVSVLLLRVMQSCPDQLPLPSASMEVCELSGPAPEKAEEAPAADRAGATKTRPPSKRQQRRPRRRRTTTNGTK